MSKRRKSKRTRSTKKSAPRRSGAKVAAGLRQARRIFERLPSDSHKGTVYFGILTDCGVPSAEAKRVAGEWMLERQLNRGEGGGLQPKHFRASTEVTG